MRQADRMSKRLSKRMLIRLLFRRDSRPPDSGRERSTRFRFVRKVLFATGLIVATAVTGACATPAPPGQAEYVRYCAACHGTEGRSDASMLSTPNLANPVLLSLASDEFLFESVRMGRPGENGRSKPGTKMSVYGADLGGPLQSDEIRQIVAYVRSWQSEPTIEMDAAYTANADGDAGGALYARQCAECHGADGWGELAPRLAGATFQSIASDDFIRQSILLGRPGTRMPAFDYSAEEVDQVVAFIRTLGDTSGR